MNATSIKIHLIGLCYQLKKIVTEMLINHSKTFVIFVGLLVFVSCSDAPNEADLILTSSNVILMNADKDAEPLSIAIADI